jgi:hypothetical protein
MDNLSKPVDMNARVVADTDRGPIVEIEFKGKARDGCGNELSNFVGEVLRETKPAGILQNFSSFKITSWDDIGP